MTTLLVKNVLTGEEAALFHGDQRALADKLVAVLRRQSRKQGEPGPDGWTVIEQSKKVQDRDDPPTGGGDIADSSSRLDGDQP